MVKRFKQCRDANVSVGGPILKEKADNFAIKPVTGGLNILLAFLRTFTEQFNNLDDKRERKYY